MSWRHKFSLPDMRREEVYAPPCPHIWLSPAPRAHVPCSLGACYANSDAAPLQAVSSATITILNALMSLLDCQLPSPSTGPAP